MGTLNPTRYWLDPKKLNTQDQNIVKNFGEKYGWTAYDQSKEQPIEQAMRTGPLKQGQFHVQFVEAMRAYRIEWYPYAQSVVSDTQLCLSICIADIELSQAAVPSNLLNKFASQLLYAKYDYEEEHNLDSNGKPKTIRYESFIQLLRAELGGIGGVCYRDNTGRFTWQLPNRTFTYDLDAELCGKWTHGLAYFVASCLKRKLQRELSHA